MVGEHGITNTCFSNSSPMLIIFGWISWSVCLYYFPSAIAEHSTFRMASEVPGHKDLASSDD